MHVVHIRLRGGADHFDQAAYAAPSGETFAIEITNASFTASGEPLPGSIAISRASDPARASPPDSPHVWSYDARKAIFVAPAVTAPSTQTVEVQGLEAGRYVLQDIDGASHTAEAVLIVGP